MMMNGLILDDNMSNLTSASNEASISSSNRNEVGSLYPQQQSFASPNQPPLAKKKRNLPGNPDPEAEVMALSPKTLMATNRFICEICNKGFQRDQNLQLHRRGHNLPWKLKQRANKEVIKKKVYVCPEPTCVHHDPSRALGDLTGIKKHFSRKHGEKKWKCEKCSKRYAVQSDWKAHSKICGTREYRCDCGTLFSRRDSFITHRAFCDALAEESARSITLANHPLLSSSQPPITSSSHFNHHLQNHHLHNPPTLQPFPLMKREQQDQSFNNLIRPPPELPPWLACQPLVGEGGAPPPIDLSTQLFSSRLDQHQHQHHHSFIHHNENPNPSTSLSTTTTTPSLPSFQPTSSPHMSATALLQKAAQMGVTMSKPCPSESLILNRPHKAHHMSCSSTSLASSTAGSGLDLSSREEMEISGFSQSLASFGNKAVVTSGYMEQVGATMVGSSLPCGSGFEGSSSFEEALNGMLNPRMESHFQETFSKPAAMETHLRRSNEGGGVGGGNDGLTRDFLGLRTISHRGFPNMAGLDHMNSPSSSYDQQNQNQTPWQGRLTLIKSVTSALPMYYLSLFKMPVGVAREFEKLQAAFLWGGSGSKKPIYLVKWDVVAKSVNQGGLGIRRIRLVNDCLLLKWWWRFAKEKDALWRQIICSKYKLDVNSWCPSPLSSNSYSAVWKGIISIEERSGNLMLFYRNNFLVQVGDGKRIIFWKDRWCSNCCLKDEFPTLFRLVMEKEISLHLMHDRRVAAGDWNFLFRRRLYDWEEREVSRLKVLLLSSSNCCVNLEDKPVWLAEGSGMFSVSYVYRSVAVSLGPSLFTSKLVWNNLAPPKVQFFCWLAWQNRVKSADFLQKIGVLQASSPALCAFCKSVAEFNCHVLLHCQFSWRVWAAMLNWWEVQGALPGSVEDVLHWWEGVKLSKKEKLLWKVIPSAVFWSLWKLRNECIFQAAKPHLEDLCELIKIRVALWLNHKFKGFNFTVQDFLTNLRQIRYCLGSKSVRCG